MLILTDNHDCKSLLLVCLQKKLEKQQETMKSSLEKEEKELEQQRKLFMQEKQQWDELNKDEEERLKQTLDKE
jgi:hypothetical protein